MKVKSAAAPPRIAVRAIPASRSTANPKSKTPARLVPVKPVASSATLRSAMTAVVTPVAPVVLQVKQNGAAQQTARLARRDRVVLEHLPLVKAIAVRVHENLPVHVDLDDLVHAGILGLFDAANKFNPDKQVVFSSYAKHR
ncbi:MAG TPA: sigma factor, partial [Bryobacteraceae bacterium]|nr:sigma factor [Bryobacteraceae bacterium]